MAIILRPEQQRAIDEISAAILAGHSSVLLQSPTGSGKTMIGGRMLGGAFAKGKFALFICNRIELVDQTAETLERLEIPYGIFAAGYPYDPTKAIQICSIETLKRRIKKLPFTPALVIWDECRGLGAAGWTATYNLFPNAKHVGLDATPTRLDGKGLGRYFSHLVCGPSYRELQELGRLVPFRVCAPSVPNLAKVHTRMGDYVNSEIESIMDTPKIVGDAVRDYCRLGAGKRALIFCITRKHSQHVAEEFRNAGVTALHIDGETPKQERRESLRAFRRGTVKVISNVDLFTSGLDVPAVEYIGMLRPTQSISLFLQMCGRGSRPEPGKSYCILADHAGNSLNHGLPDDDRVFSLEDGLIESSAKRPNAIRTCRQCFSIYRAAVGPVCPYCGNDNTDQKKLPKQIDGELSEQNPIYIAKMRELQQEAQRTGELARLERVRIMKGYRYGWSQHVLRGRLHKKAMRELQG